MSTSPEIQWALLVSCTHCGRGTEVSLPTDGAAVERCLAQKAWFTAVLTPPGQAPVVLGALCSECAPNVFPPDVLQAAEAHRQKLLQRAVEP